MKPKRIKQSMKGPKAFEVLVKIYEERDDSKYELSEGERVVYDPMHGFFSYILDLPSMEILVPKMCGDGKFWSDKIRELAYATRHLGVKGVLFCTKRNSYVYMRIVGGKLRSVEHTFNFETNKARSIWFIFVSFDDHK